MENDGIGHFIVKIMDEVGFIIFNPARFVCVPHTVEFLCTKYIYLSICA